MVGIFLEIPIYADNDEEAISKAREEIDKRKEINFSAGVVLVERRVIKEFVGGQKREVPNLEDFNPFSKGKKEEK